MTREPTSPTNRLVVALAAGVHVAHQLWPDVHGDQQVRAVVFFAYRCLQGLYLDDPRAADEALHKMDDARVRITGNEEP